jgi:hypothetical protein
MVKIRLTFKPNRRVMKIFSTLINNDIERIGVLSSASSEIKDFWKIHIYDFFNARLSHGLSTTGQLGKSLQVKINKSASTLNFFMTPIHNIRTKVMLPPRVVQFRMPNVDNFRFALPSFSFGFGRIIDYDYGKLMREGFSSSNNGRYDFTRDCKVKPGIHPGYDKNTRWDPWKKVFDKTAKEILVKHLVNELAKNGIHIKRVKP